LPWADLLRRTFGIDVLVCPQCAGPRRVLAAIHGNGNMKRDPSGSLKRDPLPDAA
jgi:hypothetical protein